MAVLIGGAVFLFVTRRGLTVTVNGVNSNDLLDSVK